MAAIDKLVTDVLMDTGLLKKKRHIVNQMYKNRSQYEGVWRQLSKYINPYRGRFDEDLSADGKRRDTYLLDPLPQLASRRCAAGIHSGLTSPSRPWFRLMLADPGQEDDHQIRQWLNDCEEIMMSIYAKSNIYNALQQIEEELAQFGTAACLLTEDYDTAIWARPYTCGEYAGAVDDKGRVVKFARKMRMYAYQIVDEFGEESCSDSVKSANAANNMATLFDVWMLVEKNRDYDPEKLTFGNFPWQAFYFEESGDKFLKVAGYNEQPFLMPRWTVVANAVYGVGPGHDALGNAMQLQKLEKLDLQLTDNRANPPLVVPSSVGKVDRNPGGITLVSDPHGAQIFPLLGNGTGSREDLNQKIQVKSDQIQEAFFNDLLAQFTLADNPQMTAREVAERHEEKLLMLAPVIEQMHNEVLSPLTKRTFGILMRHNVLPPVPEGINPDTIKVDFVSLLAQAQQMVAIPAIERTLALAGNLAGNVPDVLDNINFDTVLREHANLNGAPEIIFRDKDEVEQMRQQRAEQQAQQQQVQEAAALADPIKKGVEAARLLSETQVSKPEVLQGIL